METRPVPTKSAHTAPVPSLRSTQETAVTPPAKKDEHRSGYGLPCAKCRTYYAADAKLCPVCGASERGVPLVASLPTSALKQLPVPDPETAQEERDRFLRDFKTQVDEARERRPPQPSQACSQKSNHPEGGAPARVCQYCFDAVRQRADNMEAALHMDLQEAAQVVYEAVWADSSDPGKTYENAALALLTELRRRAGMPNVLGAAPGFSN
jgi:hypothetical protein